MANQLPLIRHSTFALWFRLSQRWLRHGLFDERFANRLALLDEPNLADLGEPRARRNKTTHDDVLLEAAPTIHFADRRPLGKNARRVPECARRAKALGFERGL